MQLRKRGAPNWFAHPFAHKQVRQGVTKGHISREQHLRSSFALTSPDGCMTVVVQALLLLIRRFSRASIGPRLWRFLRQCLHADRHLGWLLFWAPIFRTIRHVLDTTQEFAVKDREPRIGVRGPAAPAVGDFAQLVFCRQAFSDRLARDRGVSHAISPESAPPCTV